MAILSFPQPDLSCSDNAAWLPLPLAPQAAARSRFSGDAKLAQAIPLHGALTWLAEQVDPSRPPAGLEICGPGDPMASWPLIRQSLAQLHQDYPDLPLGLTTLGLGLAKEADQLAELGVRRVTLLVNAISVPLLEKIYAWIRPGKRNLPLSQAAAILLTEQSRAANACRVAGLELVVRSEVLAGVNENEIEEIARRMAKLDATAMELCPGRDARIMGDQGKLPSPEAMAGLLAAAQGHIRDTRLRQAASLEHSLPEDKGILPKPTAERPNAAALSSNGMDIDLHLGQATQALIYGPRDDGLACLLETRALPEPGKGDRRWHTLAQTLGDCFVLLATSAGQRPRQVLEQEGLPLILMTDTVEGTVDVLYGGGKKLKCKTS